MSAKKRSESDEAAHATRAKKRSPDKQARKQRSCDVGRALRTIYDESLLDVETVNFNAGTHTDSITMAREDLVRLGGGELASSW